MGTLFRIMAQAGRGTWMPHKMTTKSEAWKLSTRVSILVRCEQDLDRLCGLSLLLVPCFCRSCLSQVTLLRKAIGHAVSHTSSITDITATSAINNKTMQSCY